MTSEEKIKSLCAEIHSKLTPLINSDYVLYDLPYHNNIGDLLIWKGELSFLKSRPYRMLCKNSICTYQEHPLDSKVAILLHGGGNFGDIWREMQDFRLRIIEKYPQNPILVFPQTVFYENINTLKSDARLMGKHKNLTICARDSVSYKLLKENFSNNILLVPDMAFCISPIQLEKYRRVAEDKTLFLKRSDKEFKDIDYAFNPKYPVTVSDWPSMEHSDFVQLGMRYALKFRRLHMPFVTDCYAGFYREQLIKKGVRFISSYREIYTTRLHVAILSVLLGKSFHFFDNSYGKNRAFYDTWLNDVDNAVFE